MNTYTVYKNNLEMTLYSKSTLELYLKNGWSLNKKTKTIVKTETIKNAKKRS